MPQNKTELEIWWSAYLASLAGGKAPRGAQAAAIQALEDYREALAHAESTESWSQ